MKLEWFCLKGHRDFWYSSPFYASGFVNNYLIESAIILSGGQINQFSRFCKFINLGKASVTSFYNNQKLYVNQAVQQQYGKKEEEIIAKLKDLSQVICGDCQLDSPGWSATKGTYTFMEHGTKKLVAMQFGDKREVCLIYIYIRMM